MNFHKQVATLGLFGLLIASSARGIVEKIQVFYEGIKDLRGQFTQRVELAMGQVEEARGVFYLKRPGMMRWEYEQPERRLLVTDGSTLWTYTPADHQVILQDLTAAVTSIPFDFLVGTGRLADQFVVQQEMIHGDYTRLVLRPRRPDPHLREMEMEIETATLHIRSLAFRDQYDNRTVMQFFRLRTNTDLPADLFSFVPPPGVKILRAEDLFPR